MPSNNIGARLSTVEYDNNSPSPIDNFSHLHSTAVINDTVNWIRVSGSIIADSAYEHIMVGNFYDDLNTDTLHYTCSTCLNTFSYYLVDDVCLSTDSLFCNSGIDLLPCNVSVNELNFYDGVKVFPNPVYDFLNIDFSENQDAEIMLYDVFGKLILKKAISNARNLTLDLRSIAPGCYYLELSTIKNKNVIVKKIISPLLVFG